MVCKTDQPKIFTVSRVLKESHGVKTIFLKGSFECLPGQFVMVWLPKVDEKPMAVAYQTKDEFGFTYHTIGPFTKACDKVKKGDKIGIRGPYGKAFSQKKNAVVVGGGVGISSVSTLIDVLKSPIVIHGARSKDHLIYTKRYKNMMLCTDDGSAGEKGFTTDMLRKVLEEKKVSIVYHCGPEVMMKGVLDLCNEFNVECEGAVERYMKCGFGVCGNCMIDDKIVCVDGPVFSRKELNDMKEFGKFARLKTGRKVSLKEYYAWRT